MIEYREVEVISTAELSSVGREGWRPAALRWEERLVSVDPPLLRQEHTYIGQRVTHVRRLCIGWSGLLWREVPDDNRD